MTVKVEPSTPPTPHPTANRPPPLHVRRRRGTRDDWPYIIKSWIRCQRESEVSKVIPTSIYYANQRELILRLLRDGNIEILCDTKDDNYIYSFIVFRWINTEFVVDFLYTHSIYRKRGLATELLHSLCPHFKEHYIFVTAHTPLLRYYVQRWKLFYHPYLLLGNPQSVEIDIDETNRPWVPKHPKL